MRRALAAAALTATLVAGAPAGVRQAAAVDLCGATYYCGYLDIQLQGDGAGSVKAGSSDELQCTYANLASQPAPCNLQFAWPHAAGSVLVVPYTFTASTGSGGCLGFTLCDGTFASHTDSAIVYPTATTVLTGSFWLNRYSVTVTKDGTGSGTLSYSGFDCGPACNLSQVAYGSSRSFSVAADPGSSFGGWTGPCAGQGTTCTIVVQENEDFTATFDGAAASPSVRPTAKPTPRSSGQSAGSGSPTDGGQASTAPTLGDGSGSAATPADTGAEPMTPVATDAGSTVGSDAAGGSPILVIVLIVVAVGLAALAVAVLLGGRRRPA